MPSSVLREIATPQKYCNNPDNVDNIVYSLIKIEQCRSNLHLSPKTALPHIFYSPAQAYVYFAKLSALLSHNLHEADIESKTFPHLTSNLSCMALLGTSTELTTTLGK